MRSGEMRWPMLVMALIALASPLLAGSAQAQCGGLCIYEVASPQMGSSYAGAPALAQDAATAYLNPAGMTRLEKAEILQGAYAGIFNINFDANQGKTVPPSLPGGGVSPFTNSGGNVASFLLGVGTYAVILLGEDLRFGMAINGIFGGSADYDNNWVGRTFITDVNLIILNLEPSLAYRVNDWLSIGAGLNVYLELSGGDAPGFEYDFTLPQGLNVGIYHELTDDLALLFDAGWSEWDKFSQQQIIVAGTNISFSRGWKGTWRFCSPLPWVDCPTPPST